MFSIQFPSRRGRFLMHDQRLVTGRAKTNPGFIKQRGIKRQPKDNDCHQSAD